jgi:hypothetical protein
VVDLNAIPKDSWVWKIKDYSVEIKARQDKDPSDPWIGILQEVRDAKILGNEDLYKKYGNSITGSQGIISKAKVSAAAATAADAITRDDAQKIAEDKSNQEWAKIDETKRSNAAKELISRTKATNASGASKITADQKAEMATIMQSMIASGDPVAFLQNLPAGAISKAELDILMPMAKAGTYNDESLVMANASPEQRKYFQGLVAEFDKQDAATALSNLEKAPNSTAKDPLGAYLYRLLVKRLTERQTSEKTAEIKNPPPVKATDPKYDVSNDPISTRVIQMQNETTNSVNADGDPVKVPRFTEADLVRYIEANTSGDPIRGSKVKTYTGVMSSSTQAPK